MSASKTVAGTLHHPEHNTICQFDLLYFMFNYTHTQTHIGGGKKKKTGEREAQLHPFLFIFYLNALRKCANLS